MAWSHILLCLYFSTIIPTYVTSTDLRIMNFSASSACNLQARLDAKCAVLHPGKFRKAVECAVKCETDCVGVSFLDNNKCYIHFECPMGIAVAICDNKDAMFPFYFKDVMCQHKGKCNETTGLCDCVGGWVGLHCERPPTSCQELVTFRYQIPLKITVYIKVASLDKPFKVICNLNAGFVTTRLMYNSGSLKPNRTWQEYVNGFYLDNNFWVGLEKIKALNADKLTILKVDTQFGLETTGYNFFSYIYNDFHLLDSEAGYSFTYGTSGPKGSGTEYNKYNSSYSSCLANAVGAPFSTFDRDNDTVPQQNCAALMGNGWWFKNCELTCNPLGSRKDWLAMTGIDLTSATYAESLMYFTTK